MNHIPTFKLDKICEGTGRIYYTTPHKEKSRTPLLYCYMEEEDGSFNFYRCSLDGEPSHKVTFMEISIQVPKKSQTALAKRFINWLYKPNT